MLIAMLRPRCWPSRTTRPAIRPFRRESAQASGGRWRRGCSILRAPAPVRGNTGLTMFRSLAAAALLLMPATLAAASDAHNWQVYHDLRFDSRIEYPADLFGEPRMSDNGDGSTWTSRDEGSLRVFGFWNVSEQTPVTYEAFLRKARPHRYARVTYRISRRRLLILSGVEAGQVFYERYAFDDPADAVHALVLEYPVTMRSSFDPVVGRMSASLGRSSGRK